MASIARQPFAPLDGSRLQSLTSIKNRQNNALPSPSPKRKAEEPDLDDFENVSPLLFTKRAKSSFASSPKDALAKSSLSYHLAHKPSRPSSLSSSVSCTPTAPAGLPARTVLKPKSPSARLLTSLASLSSPAKPVSTPARTPATTSSVSVPPLSSLSTPAGRSPPRAKRSGILSRRRASGYSPYGRVDPPRLGLGRSDNAVPFGLDAALKGTIPTYKSRQAAGRKTNPESWSLPSPRGVKPSWFFDIHEDTPEQEMTNMLQHSTCVLDISSDEEHETKATMEKAEGRNKENVPPADDVSQTSSQRRASDELDPIKGRRALVDLNVEDYYAAGCDSLSVFVVPADEDEDADDEDADDEEAAPVMLEPEMEMKPTDELLDAALDRTDSIGETFDLWESGSAHGDEVQ